MITPKRFILILIATFLLGFGLMFMYHVINKPEPVEVVVDINTKLKFSFDSLLTEVKIKDLTVGKLKIELQNVSTKYDSLIIKNQNNGKGKKVALHSLSHDSLVEWNRKHLESNNIK